MAASRHSAVATSEGHVWTMGHNNSKGGGGHGSPPMDASGQLGRGGGKQPGRVLGALEVRRVALGTWGVGGVVGWGEGQGKVGWR